MKLVVLLALCGSLAACSGTKPAPTGVKVGKPYVIEGKTYYPSVDSSYDRTGTASWYGPGFHGKYTANGEEYDQNDLTAAHPTLPMPSLVRVTNIENGKSLIVRINDRGPFKKNRIIDLSRASAQSLGIHSLAKVRVQFLREETERYIASKQWSNVDMAALNRDIEKRAQEQEMAMVQAEPAVATSDDQIVESTVSASYAGQTVNDAAPVMTVSSGELETPTPKTVTISDNMPKPVEVAIENSTEDEFADEKPIRKTVEVAKEQPVQSNVRINENETITELPEQPEPKTVAVKKSDPVEAAPSSNGRFIIRAGSFSSEQNAYKLVGKVANSAKAIVNKIETNGKTWWRVHVGPFADRQEAEQVLAKVHSSGAPDAVIARQ